MFGKQRFVERQSIGQRVSIDDVEANLAVFSFRGGQANTVDRKPKQGSETIPRMETKRPSPWSLRTLTPNSAASGFSDVFIRELADGVRGKDGDDAVVCTLAGESGVQGAALADDEDILDIANIVTQRDRRRDRVIDAGQVHGDFARISTHIGDAQRVAAGSKTRDPERTIACRGRRLTGSRTRMVAPSRPTVSDVSVTRPVIVPAKALVAVARASTDAVPSMRSD